MTKKELPNGQDLKPVKEVKEVKPVVQESIKKQGNSKVEKEVQQIERKIDEAEKKIQEMEAHIATLTFDENNQHLDTLSNYEEAKNQLETMMSNWELKMSEI
jgi:DNA mismatch repair ATPase MutS